MAQTIDSIAPGRFGVNIVTGWSKPEFQSLGIWPGDDHFERRYDRAAEYVQIMRDLWETGESTRDGDFYQTAGAKLAPRPDRIEVVGAGQSAEGMHFVATYGDYNFIMGRGINTPLEFLPTVDRLMEAKAETGRDIGAYALFMLIAAETDEEAFAKWEHYSAGTDYSVINNVANMGSQNKQMSKLSSTQIMYASDQAVNLNTGTFIGSYANVARMLDEVAEVQGVKGIMLIFDDFIEGLEAFGEKIQPLMKCRQDRLSPVAA